MFTEIQMMSEDQNPTEETTRVVRTVPSGKGTIWRQQRDFLCYASGSAPGHKGVIPVPGPTNNQLVAGECLIWCGPLNADGYPRKGMSLREVFRRSRGRQPSGHVLHLCHRRSCVQPSHLYEGSPSDNGEDRHHRFGGNRALKWDLPQDGRPLLDRLYASMPPTDWGRVQKEFDIAQEVAAYYNSPEGRQMPFAGTQPRFLEHDCVPGAPAGDVRLCQICDLSPRGRAAIPTLENMLRWESYWPQAVRRTSDTGPWHFFPQTQN